MALSLRQVTKEVGIVPTAFYRHLDDRGPGTGPRRGVLRLGLARLTDPSYWTTEDLRVQSNMIVTSMVGTAETILSSRPEAEEAIAEQSRTQLRMLLVGALGWRSQGLG